MIMSAYKVRTVVFTLPVGSRVVPQDFLEALGSIKGMMVAFGSVGVSHIWHLTCVSESAVDVLVSNGDFLIKENSIPVRVSRLSDIPTVAVVHWLPFWIDNFVIENTLRNHLPSSTSIAVSHKLVSGGGFSNVYSTQRRVQGVGDLSGLPYFVEIESQGKRYRAHIFVPGREQVCFSCHKVGHMKGQCPQVQQEVSEQVEGQAENQDTSHGSSNQDNCRSPHLSEYSSLGHGHYRSFVCSSEFEYQGDSEPEPVVADRGYKVSLGSKGSLGFFQRKGADLVVSPPSYSTIEDEVYEEGQSRCTTDVCMLMGHWRKGLLSAKRFEFHLSNYHLGSFALVEA